MDDDDPDSLDKLAGSVADGDSIDWEDLERLPSDDPRRRLLKHLRVVAEIAEQHRSAVEDPVADVASTGPAVDRRAYVGRVRGSATGGVLESIGQWGHLELRRKIGEGAFGEVFHAHDSWLDHPVALKLLRPDVAEVDFSSRILHEARRLARVRHPNVVSVHGADMHDGRVGFWMDLIEGQTLSELLANGRLSHGEASNIAQEVCLALAAVHHANLVHRDVKAQNVMRASDGGRIILMDFGAGEFMGTPSASRRVRGTPLYLAPEIFKGSSATVSTDIYALGVLLFHLVTREYPVTASSLEGLVDAHAKGERRRLRDARPDLPASFIAVVERAIDPVPDRRYASAGDFYDALKRGEASLFTLKNLRRAGVMVASVLAASWVLGLFASRVFEATLHVDPIFSTSVTDYFMVGLRALFPFTVFWMFYAAVAAALVGLRALVWPHVGPIRRRFSILSERLDASTQAGLIVCVGATVLVLLAWSFYQVYNAFVALGMDQRPESLDLFILGPAGRNLHRNHILVSTTLSFLMGLAAWFWFPQLEKRATEPSRVRNLKWAAIVVAFLAIALEVGVRPLLWDRREVVMFGNRQAFVIGMTSDELLLYTPAKGERRSLRVRQDAPDLRRNVARVPLFDTVPEVK